VRVVGSTGKESEHVTDGVSVTGLRSTTSPGASTKGAAMLAGYEPEFYISRNSEAESKTKDAMVFDSALLVFLCG
jgi:hypothetical protein